MQEVRLLTSWYRASKTLFREMNITSIGNEIHAKTIVIATQNEKKKGEILEILKNVPGILLRGVEDFPFSPAVEEDGNSFRENAIKRQPSLPMPVIPGQWQMIRDLESMP